MCYRRWVTATTPGDGTVELTVDDSVATALINGPATRNALSRGVQDQLLASVEAAGLGRALDLILTGRVLDARQALDIGLVTYLAEPSELLATVREVASAVAARGPLATRLAKIAVRAALDTDLRTGLALERLAQSILHTTADKQEGISAFLDKRTAHFDGS
jgi:enoyl-CoA hydratase/carnithine racemase